MLIFVFVDRLLYDRTGDNSNEVVLVYWYWYIFCLHVPRGVYVVGRAVTRQTVIGCVGRWDRIAVAIPTPPICQPTVFLSENIPHIVLTSIRTLLRTYMKCMNSHESPLRSQISPSISS
jgi:hypothetical protein